MREMLDSVFYVLGALSFFGMILLVSVLLSSYVAERFSNVLGLSLLALSGLTTMALILFVWG